MIFVVGPPASGKTSACLTLLKSLQLRRVPASYVSDGQVLEEICGEDPSHDFHRVVDGAIVFGEETRKEIYKRLAFKALNSSPECCVIIEMATNEWEAAFEHYPSKVIEKSILINIESSLIECIERNKLRSQKNPDQFNVLVPEQVIYRMFDESEVVDRSVRTPSFSRKFQLRNYNVSIGTFLRDVKALLRYIIAE